MNNTIANPLNPLNPLYHQTMKHISNTQYDSDMMSNLGIIILLMIVIIVAIIIYLINKE